MVFSRHHASSRERSAVRQAAGRLRFCIFSGVFAALTVGTAFATQGVSMFTPFTSDPRKLLEGSWYSCREPDGQYGERVYDHVVNGLGQFEVHLGPRREFAIFKGVQDVHRDHDSPENLLKPYRVTLDAGRARQRWEIPSLNLLFTVALAGGSRTDCDSWFIVLEPLEKTSF
jgi:hypothetical protein